MKSYNRGVAVGYELAAESLRQVLINKAEPVTAHDVSRRLIIDRAAERKYKTPSFVGGQAFGGEIDWFGVARGLVERGL